MKKRLFSALLALCMVCSLLPLHALAADSDTITIQTSHTSPILKTAPEISIQLTGEEASVLYASDEIDYEPSTEWAGDNLRAQLLEKPGVAVAYLQTSDYTEEDLTYQALEILSYAMEHTGRPYEGDFLSMNIGAIQISVEGYEENGWAYLTYTYELGYYTSAQQDSELEAAIAEVIESFDADRKDNYTRFTELYDYVCANVAYTGAPTEDSPLEEFTAYGALINGKANSYGIAHLLYRLALELGVDNRVVLGEYGGSEHAWNIVSMGSRFYHVDAALDAGKSTPSYFLRGSKGLTDHAIYEEYTVVPFADAHPIDTADLPKENAVDSSGTCGENLTWTLDIRGTMTISGTGAMENYGDNTPSWNKIEHRIKCLIVEDGVTHIGSSAFYQALYLTNVILPDSVQTIGEAAFRACWRLRSINIPDSVTKIPNLCFSGCEILEQIQLPDSITSIGDEAFGGTNISTITIPVNCIEISSMNPFSGCNRLAEIHVAEGNPAYCAIDGALYDATVSTLVLSPPGKTELIVPDTVTALNAYCASNTNLVHVTLGSGVTVLHDGVFFSCPKLEYVIFTGPAPAMENRPISGAICFYPASDPSYSEEYRAEHFYVEWVPYCNEHSTVIQGAYEPTCEQDGYTGDEVCELCGNVVAYGEAIPANGHNFVDKVCTVCGNGEVYRLYGANRYETSFIVADTLKDELGVEKFENIVVANGKAFADALAGSYLAVQKNAPILLTNQNLLEDVAAYIEANLASGGTVYLLGGTSAVPAEMEELLEGLDVVRLAGENRYETNLLILEEAGIGDEEILICTGRGFADSLSASAVGKPILLVNKTLYEDQKEFLEATSGEFVIIGGESAVSVALAEELEDYGSIERLAGANRFETSVLVAEHFFDEPDSAVLAYSQNFPDGLCGGPLAAAMDAPLLLIATKRGDVVVEYANETGISCGAVLGGTGLIDDATAREVFGLDENATPMAK